MFFYFKVPDNLNWKLAVCFRETFSIRQYVTAKWTIWGTKINNVKPWKVYRGLSAMSLKKFTWLSIFWKTSVLNDNDHDKQKHMTIIIRHSFQISFGGFECSNSIEQLINYRNQLLTLFYWHNIIHKIRFFQNH